MLDYFTSNEVVGLIGVGNAGLKLRDAALAADCHVILCDPPRSLEEASELSEHFFELWGNGMGGCQLSNVGMETFVPLDALARADKICIQVPLTSEGPFATRGMITNSFLSKCKPDAQILCFSDKAVIADDAQADKRIKYMQW